jgi:hypothetical protein
VALHSEAKKALDSYAEQRLYGDEPYGFSYGGVAPKAFAALNAILIACKSAEDNLGRSPTGRMPQVSVSGLRAIIARELG